jgi:hypothetical protein
LLLFFIHFFHYHYHYHYYERIPEIAKIGGINTEWESNLGKTPMKIKEGREGENGSMGRTKVEGEERG